METATGLTKPPEGQTRHLLLRAPEPSDVDSLLFWSRVAQRYDQLVDPQIGPVKRMEIHDRRPVKVVPGLRPGA